MQFPEFTSESISSIRAGRATDALAVAVEVVDSRIEDWNTKLPDTIADNASYGGFTAGPWSCSLRESDLRTWA